MVGNKLAGFKVANWRYMLLAINLYYEKLYVSRSSVVHTWARFSQSKSILNLATAETEQGFKFRNVNLANLINYIKGFAIFRI